MADQDAEFLSQFDLLSSPGVVGLFDHFELVEVLAFRAGCPDPTNIFTIAVGLENGNPCTAEFLNDKRIRIAGLKDRFFGIYRSLLRVDDLRAALEHFFDNGVWKPAAESVSVGNLVAVEKRFVPADSIDQIGLNRVTKNNFFNGCYLLELFDLNKPSVRWLTDNPPALQELSRKVSEIIPLEFASLSDRLGNIIIQFPIDAVRAQFGIGGGNYQVEVAWHPQVEERELIATATSEHDKSIITFGQRKILSGQTTLCPNVGYGTLQGFLWDAGNDLLLAATGEIAFLRTMSLNSAVTGPEPRVFPATLDPDARQERVWLSSFPELNLIGSDPTKSIAEPIGARIFEEEQDNLARQHEFVQYAAEPKSRGVDRQRALDDLRELICSHGAQGVWLWDPFLGPQDILDTLFCNPTSNAPMRALTFLKVRSDVEKKANADLAASYRHKLSSLQSNYLGINIEFRSGHGPQGWQFHDRFLIFPKSGDKAAKAWSLGTSVNGVGNSHHILQQVDNAQFIAHAFQRLWSAVDGPANLIWKFPE
ncbi:VPA1262 family N-terminal domain-containing protein [Candidatus Thiosymbion oneisti]|uniref:VPA1262 family N-terminal domain-containing protein n=1 Tax=Candidatus Thiosymbion oneisti TaxID=589554 RepID=UPI000B7C9652|nr:VPA1262 family N-terminal domain-containing protein [Candidatus Thiosymbion oneisti]